MPGVQYLDSRKQSLCAVFVFSAGVDYIGEKNKGLKKKRTKWVLLNLEW